MRRTLENRTKGSQTSSQDNIVQKTTQRRWPQGPSDSLYGQVLNGERAIGGPRRRRAAALDDGGCFLRHILRVLENPLHLWFIRSRRHIPRARHEETRQTGSMKGGVGVFRGVRPLTPQVRHDRCTGKITGCSAFN